MNQKSVAVTDIRVPFGSIFAIVFKVILALMIFAFLFGLVAGFFFAISS